MEHPRDLDLTVSASEGAQQHARGVGAQVVAALTGLQHQRLFHVLAAELELARGPDREMAAGRASRRQNTGGPSKRGKQSQSTEPSRLTRAAERQSESSAYSPIGRLSITVSSRPRARASCPK